MYLGQFPTDAQFAVENVDCVTDISSHRKFLAEQRDDSQNTSQRGKQMEIDPFPKVDDIIDRLTSDTEVANMRVRARS